MRVSKLNNSNKLVLLNTRKYLINWKDDGSSSLEKKFIDLIFPFWKNQIILFQCRIPGSLLRLDFLNINKRLVVEIDGAQHNTFNKHFHSNSRNVFLGAIRRDLAKETWCEQNQISVLHLNEEDLDNFSPKYIFQKFNINIL